MNGSPHMNRNGSSIVINSAPPSAIRSELQQPVFSPAIRFAPEALSVVNSAKARLTVYWSYALAETFQWRQGLGRKLKSARAFYGLIISSTVIGIALDFANVSPLKALFWAAAANGLLAPFLLLGILIIACDRKIMVQQPSSLWGGWWLELWHS